MSDQNFIKKMITLIKKMLNPNLDMYPRNKNKSRITMLDVENELTKLKEMKNNGIKYNSLSKKNFKMGTWYDVPKKLHDDSVSQIAGYGQVINNLGKTKKIKNKRKKRLSKWIIPYNRRKIERRKKNRRKIERRKKNTRYI